VLVFVIFREKCENIATVNLTLIATLISKADWSSKSEWLLSNGTLLSNKSGSIKDNEPNVNIGLVISVCAQFQCCGYAVACRTSVVGSRFRPPNFWVWRPLCLSTIKDNNITVFGKEATSIPLRLSDFLTENETKTWHRHSTVVKSSCHFVTPFPRMFWWRWHEHVWNFNGFKIRFECHH